MYSYILISFSAANLYSLCIPISLLVTTCPLLFEGFWDIALGYLPSAEHSQDMGDTIPLSWAVTTWGCAQARSIPASKGCPSQPGRLCWCNKRRREVLGRRQEGFSAGEVPRAPLDTERFVQARGRLSARSLKGT